MALVVDFFGGWGVVNAPWLAGMVFLFAFEFIEGSTVTRLYFMRLRRLTREALAGGGFTRELEEARAEGVPPYPARDRQPRYAQAEHLDVVPCGPGDCHSRRHSVDDSGPASVSMGSPAGWA